MKRSTDTAFREISNSRAALCICNSVITSVEDTAAVPFGPCWSGVVAVALVALPTSRNFGTSYLITTSLDTCQKAYLLSGRITALQAVDLWKKHFAERGVMEPDHSSLYIVAHLLGAKTELVELVLTDLEMKPGSGIGADGQRTCLEVGCGSGAISLSLLKSLPQLKVTALDQSQDAVDLTRENALMRVYLEVDPRHPPLIQQWVEVNVEEMRYVETRHDITGRPRFCILRKETSTEYHKLDLD
ncbi:HemK methyltransferase family member 1 [Liparis tanakae]|uniref:HemK methyltransferase family member 1 n=1 Tax=Liparis tanakae TaxID=230148 RepID=A0A4Z2J3C1_9TELE|nr:HemK methyltransferase family member 1 [Liparis tanakae]